MYGTLFNGNEWVDGSSDGTGIPGVGLAFLECLLLEKDDFKDKFCAEKYHPMCEASCPRGEQIIVMTIMKIKFKPS